MKFAVVPALLLGSTACAYSDPDLKPGFPVKMFVSGGTFAGYPISAMIANIDLEPRLEIAATSIASGPLYAWTYNGQLSTGYPTNGSSSGLHFPAFASVSGQGRLISNIQSGPGSGQTVMLGANGAIASGWPRISGNYLSTPPSAADINGDGIDEILRGTEDRKLDVFRFDGQNWNGYPKVLNVPYQNVFTPLVADIDQDSYPDVIAQCQDRLVAFRGDNASLIPGFPSILTGPVSVSAVGDLDGDDFPDFVGITNGYQEAHLVVLDHSGHLVRDVILPNLQGEDIPSSHLVLADMTGDELPEIVVACDEGMRVLDRFGNALPGWPVEYGSGGDRRRGSSPAVGDVDGDGYPDVVIQTNIVNTSYLSEIRVYSRFGTLHPRTPKVIWSASGVHCSIADIDLDGKTDIIGLASPSQGGSLQDQIWAFDIASGACGPIQWGQVFGGAKRTGLYIPVRSTTPARSDRTMIGNDQSGSVANTRISDDSYRIVKPDYAQPRNAPVIRLEFDGYTLDASAREIGVSVESNTGSANKTISIEMWNWSTGNWTQINQFASTGVDSRTDSWLTQSVSSHVEPYTRRVRARISLYDNGASARWNFALDRLRFLMKRS